jgi:hypothetical protein
MERHDYVSKNTTKCRFSLWLSRQLEKQDLDKKQLSTPLMEAKMGG